MAKLKVFCWSDGFHAYTVAASSRAKALAAWGFSRDLFKDGSAREITSGPDHDAALEAPGQLIERGLAVDVGQSRPAKARKTKGPSKADRARVDTLETQLAELDEAQAAETSALEEQRAKLEAEAEALDRRQSKARKALVDRLKTARDKL